MSTQQAAGMHEFSPRLDILPVEMGRFPFHRYPKEHLRIGKFDHTVEWRIDKWLTS